MYSSPFGYILQLTGKLALIQLMIIILMVHPLSYHTATKVPM